MTTLALKNMNLPNRSVMRCRNFFALGVVSWLYNRPIEPSLNWIKERFRKNPDVLEANTLALQAGYNLGENTEIFASSYEVKPAKIAPGVYRNITGNTATALGFVVAAKKAGLPLFLGSYPITPASDVLHDLATFKNFGVYTFQAEDEIAGVTSALGAAFGGSIAITTTSGPGMNLKAEAIGLAAAVELPLVIADIQRAGPSTSGFSRGGCIISIVVGFIGAIIGTWLARESQLPDPFSIVIRGTSYNILWTIIGAVSFTAALSLITPGKK